MNKGGNSMSIIELIKIEFMKVKRSMILPLLLIPPILVVVSGVSSISMYMTPEYTDAWSAMFIQSALLFGYYLLPFSMVVVCVMIANREIKNNGILKMLALPVSKGKLALTKFLVLLSFLAIELLIFFSSFIICLLYTSDAADDLLCVDLYGSRIIKKKKNATTIYGVITNQTE